MVAAEQRSGRREAGGGRRLRTMVKVFGHEMIVFGKGTIVRCIIYSFRTRNKMSFESKNVFRGLQVMIVVGSMFITSLAERGRSDELSIPSCMCIVEL